MEDSQFQILDSLSSINSYIHIHLTSKFNLRISQIVYSIFIMFSNLFLESNEWKMSNFLTWLNNQTEFYSYSFLLLKILSFLMLLFLMFKLGFWIWMEVSYIFKIPQSSILFFIKILQLSIACSQQSFSIMYLWEILHH